MAPFQSLSCVPAAIRDRQPYVGDHVIRHYRSLGLAALLRDLDADPAMPELEIVGGIGRLVLRADGRDTWEPVTTHQAPPVSLQAHPDLVAARLDTCRQCDSWRDDRCTVAGCGCTGQGHAERLLSRCPLGRWPTS